MNARQIQALMDRAHRIIANFEDNGSLSTEQRRIISKYQQITYMDDEIEMLDELILMLESTVKALEARESGS